MPTLSRTYSITSSNGQINKASTKIFRPDGGWGWTVVIGSFFISFITDGFSYTTGVLYEKFLNIYGQSESITSMFTALMTGLISVMGPIAAGLSQTYGCRAVTLSGALIASISMSLSVLFDSSIHYHTITLGIGVGVGLGLMFLPQVTIVTDWFDKRISLATGLAVGGSGFGIAAFALFSNEMFNRFDWHNVMLFLSGTMFLCVFFALTFSPPPSAATVAGGGGGGGAAAAAAASSSPPASSLPISIEERKVIKEKITKSAWITFKVAVNNAFNFQMLRDLPFLYLILSNSFGCAVYYVPFILTSDRIIRAGFGTATDGAILMVYFGISNGFSRTLAGYIGDLRFINRTILYGCSVFAMGLIVAATTFANSIQQMNFLYILLGIADGIHACLGTVILVDEFGSERVYNAYGILLMFDGISSIIGPPLINYLTVFDKSYCSSLLACALVLSIAGALCAIFPCLPFHKSKHSIIESSKNAHFTITTVSSIDHFHNINNNNNINDNNNNNNNNNIININNNNNHNHITINK